MAGLDSPFRSSRYSDSVPITVVDHSGKRGWLYAQATGCMTLGEIIMFLQTVRAKSERRMAPLFFDARGAVTEMTDDDVDEAVAVVREAARRTGPRGHVAIVADDGRLYELMLRYETRCAEFGVRLIRVFRQMTDAERWLEAVSAARHFH